MTAVERAKDLYQMYYECLWYSSRKSRIKNAKQASLIAVDEIIKTFDCTAPQSIEYWEQVKHELTKQQEQ
jgi:hypothetical protein